MNSWRERPVAGIGIVGLDHVVVTDRWERDAKTTASHYIEQVGGPVPVALCGMARLGLAEPPRFYGVVGEDHAADTIRRWLSEAGVDALPIRAARGQETGHSLVVLDTSDGTRTLTNLPGPAMDSPHTVPLWVEREPRLEEAGLLHFDGRSSKACTLVAQAVRSNGGIVSFDLGRMRDDNHLLSRFCNIVIASKVGGATAFPDVADDPMEQTRRFLEMGPDIAGVTLAAAGVVIASRDHNGGEPVYLPAFSVANVVDTCGAGDLFHGAFLWAYRSGSDAIDSARFAQAAVALRIPHLGNHAGQPTREAVERFLLERA